MSLAPATSFFVNSPVPVTGQVQRNDPAVTPGHLLLWEPGASMSTLQGVPIDGQALDNLAAPEAARLLVAAFNGTISGANLTVNSVASGALQVGQTLFLVDGTTTLAVKIASGSGTSWVLSGSPGDRTANLVARFAAADLASFKPTFKLGADTGTTKFRMERTAKGGLHMMISQSLASTATYGRITLPVPLLQYLLNNVQLQTSTPTTGHRFAMFASGVVTRQGATSGAPASLGFASIDTGTRQDMAFCEIQNIIPYTAGSPQTATGTGAVVNLDPGANTLGVPLFRGGLMNSLADPTMPALSALSVHFGLGTFGAAGGSGFLNGSRSMAFSRVVLMDLFAAGLSYPDAALLERREFDKSFSVPGTILPAFSYTLNGVPTQSPAVPADGRYWGDTIPTNPASAVP